MKRHHVIATALTAIAACAWGADARADGPAGGEVRVQETRPNRAMISSGIVTLGVTYGASVIVAAESSHDGDKQLYVPVVGPWLDLTSRGGCPGNASCGAETGYKVLLIADGIFQALGALDIVGGFFMQETVVTAAKASPEKAPVIASLRVSPASMGGGYGVAALGTF